MSQHTISPEVTYAPDHSGGTGKIWRVFWILLAITAIELGLGLWVYIMHGSAAPSHGLILFAKGAICILSLAKAYYIVSVFMHLGDENRNFIMTIIVPLTLFIWFIIAFLWDGASWRDLKNTDAHSREYIPQTEQHVTETPAVSPAEEK